jgi:beta-phosphoglucomutase-like phosphatase (HAD superfamily)
MQKKAIVFDVDGVITYSGSQKDTIIEHVLDAHGLLCLP